jgi:hypothetical protein
MDDTASIIDGVVALASLIAGLCCRRLKMALIAGAVIGFARASLTLVAILRTSVLDSYNGGRLVGNVIACVLLALLGWAIRRGVSALSGRRPDTPEQTPK